MSGPLNLEQLVGFLLDTPMFRDLDAAELSEIVHIMSVRHVRAGQVLFQVGEPGDAWYVLYAGAVDMVVPTVDGAQVIDQLVPPACFGEMAVLDGYRRSAMVRATSDATVLQFPREAFGLLLAQGNLAAYKLVLQMARSLATRHRTMTLTLVDLLQRLDADAAEQLEPLMTDRRRAE